MIILDLCCGLGGASKGYSYAFPGAQIVGVDIRPQPDYPFQFYRANALTFPLDGFDLIHASPPCQGYTYLGSFSASGPRLIQLIRERLAESPAPYTVIENVAGARSELRSPIQLCGSSFMLPFKRHRYFECSWNMTPMPCLHESLGDYTDRLTGGLDQRSWSRRNQRVRSIPIYGRPGPRAQGLWQWAMGIDWSNDLEGIAQAIPPVFTHWIGRNLR